MEFINFHFSSIWLRDLHGYSSMGLRSSSSRKGDKNEKDTFWKTFKSNLYIQWNNNDYIRNYEFHAKIVLNSKLLKHFEN